MEKVMLSSEVQGIDTFTSLHKSSRTLIGYLREIRRLRTDRGFRLRPRNTPRTLRTCNSVSFVPIEVSFSLLLSWWWRVWICSLRSLDGGFFLTVGLISTGTWIGWWQVTGRLQWTTLRYVYDASKKVYRQQWFIFVNLTVFWSGIMSYHRYFLKWHSITSRGRI